MAADAPSRIRLAHWPPAGLFVFDSPSILRFFVSSVRRYSTLFSLTERCQPCELLVHHVAPVWHRRVTECVKQIGPLPGRRASHSQVTRVKTRAQRKRTRFGLVKPVAVASLPKVLKPVIDAEATSTSTHRTARGVWGGRVSTDESRTPGDPARRRDDNDAWESITMRRLRPGVGPAHSSAEAG